MACIYYNYNLLTIFNIFLVLNVHLRIHLEGDEYTRLENKKPKSPNGTINVFESYLLLQMRYLYKPVCFSTIYKY